MGKSKEEKIRGIYPNRLFPPFSLHTSSFILLTLGSGILMGFTVAPVGAWFLAWIALAPLWVLVVGSQKEKSLHPFTFILAFGKGEALYPLVWGIGYHGVALFWITGIHPMTWMGVSWINSLAIALFCWTFITLWGAALVVAWAMGMRAILAWSRLDVTKIPNPKSQIQNGLVRALIGTALWCGLESLWSAGPLWWSSLAYTQSPHNLPILHLGQLSGSNTVTAAIVLVNALFAEAGIKFQQSGVRSQESGVRLKHSGYGLRASVFWWVCTY